MTEEYFDGTTKYYEWTLLAFRLSMRHKLRFLDVPTYRKHDTPDSLYKSAGVTLNAVAVLDMLAAMNTKPSVRGTIAWRYHLLSLVHPRGWRYLPYARHLLLPFSGRE